MNKKFLALVIFSLMFFSCKHYSLNDLPKSYIVFGFNGGFTGMQKEYFILQDGGVFSKNSLNKKELALGFVKRRTVKKLIKELEKQEWNQEEHQAGNMNFYIKLKHKNEEKIMKWSLRDKAEGFHDIYDLLANTIKEVDKNND